MKCLEASGVGVRAYDKERDLVEVNIEIIWKCEDEGIIKSIKNLSPFEVIDTNVGTPSGYDIVGIGEILSKGQKLEVRIIARVNYSHYKVGESPLVIFGYKGLEAEVSVRGWRFIAGFAGFI